MLLRLVAFVLTLALAAPCLADAGPKGAPHASVRPRASGLPLYGARVRTLESFARGLGVRLGSANDQKVFDAAEAAMRASPAGLYVKIAPGRYRASRIRFGANSGYYAEAPQTVILEQVRDSRDARDEAFVALNDPYATNWLFWGFILDGRWSYGRKPFAGAPEKDPWLDHQHAVAFLNAFSGVDDRRYRANSPIGAQNPRGRYGELVIANFGGDGLRASGAGAQTASAIQVFHVGGRGLVWTTYDNNLAMVDIGDTGREGFYCGPNCANNRLDALKIWYSGVRRLPGATAGLVIDRGMSNRFSSLQIQDTAGDGLVIDRGHDNSLSLGVQWQGQIPWMEPYLAPLSLKGAVGNRVQLNASIPGYAAQKYPAASQLVRSGAGVDNSATTRNIIDIVAEGWPVPLIDVALDGTNQVILNGAALGGPRVQPRP